MEPENSLLLRCGRVFDPHLEKLIGPLDVLVEDGGIVAVGPSLTAGAAREVDLRDCTLLPGLIDLDAELLPETISGDTGLWLFEALARARELLRRGFTTARTLGGGDARWSLLDLRRAITEGLAPGARLLVAPHQLDERLAKSGLAGAVERERRNGADWIAVDRRFAAQDELDEIVASAQDTPVAVAAQTPDELRCAIAAGARSVEVSCPLDSSTARLAVQGGVYLIPRDGFATSEHPKIAFGGRLTGGVAALVELGLSAPAALVAATRAGADCAGLQDAGRIEPGARADLIAVGADPVSEIERIGDVSLVVREGIVQ